MGTVRRVRGAAGAQLSPGLGWGRRGQKKNGGAKRPRDRGGGRVCSALGRGAGRACARRDLPHVCAGGGAVTRCGRRGSIMVSAGAAAAAPSPHRCWGPAPGLPCPAWPAPRGQTARRARRRPCSSPRRGRCRGPRAAAAAPPRTSVLSPCRARGQRWVAGGRGEGGAGGWRCRKVTQSVGQGRLPGRRGGCGRSVAGGLQGLRLAARTLELRVPPRRSNGSSPVIAALQGRAAQATAGLCGDRRETCALVSISFVNFFIEKKESFTELPLFSQ